jgi:sulfur carrier protein
VIIGFGFDLTLRSLRALRETPLASVFDSEFPDLRKDMNITLNGEKKQVPDGITITGLLDFLSIQHQRVAVELNETIVKKQRYSEAVLTDGDSLEVVSFMGGGCGER